MLNYYNNNNNNNNNNNKEAMVRNSNREMLQSSENLLLLVEFSELKALSDLKLLACSHYDFSRFDQSAQHHLTCI